MGKATLFQVVNLNHPQETHFENLTDDQRLDLAKKLKEHLFKFSAVDVDEGCWEPKMTGDGTLLCINTKDNNRVMLNFSGFLKQHNIKHDKKTTAVAGAFFKILKQEHEKYNASHLCHNPKCVCPEHIVYEDAEYNRSRNYCSGVNCEHEPKCLKPGVRYHIIENPKKSFNLNNI